MIGLSKASYWRWREIDVAALGVLLFALVGCGQSATTAASPPDTTLSIGYGENPQAGIQQTVRNIALEGLIRIDSSGRPTAGLADRWSVSVDGLTWRLRLRSGATFHDGQPATADIVEEILQKELPKYVGAVFDDVEQIQAVSISELEFSLKRRSAFLLEGLDVPIQHGDMIVGTGPFSVDTQAPGEVEMRVNSTYYGGRAAIDRILFRSYDSVRAAWADMLRGRVDMLYEVGVEALSSLRGSSAATIFPFQRPYAFLVILNTKDPKLQDKAVRRALNASVDRADLVKVALEGRGTPADGPVWPKHWAYGQDMPRFQFQPRPANAKHDVLRVKCLLLANQAHERMSLVLQRQLRAVGVEFDFEQLPSDEFVRRVLAGSFEAALTDARMGPAILLQNLFWASGGPNNWGHYSSREVDESLDLIRGAADEAAYRAGVVELQRAIIDDPPAIFLAWGERLRAVTTRFDVPVEPGRDILSAPLLRLWRPNADGRVISPN